MNKDLIHSRFTKNLKTYNENAKIQRKMAEKLITFVQNKAPKKILEIGCGTGFLTRLVNENFQFINYKAIDIVEDCKIYINEINPKIEFIANDVEKYLETTSETFDLIISNATLQWIENFETTIKKLQSILTPNGELVFSTFGTENYREIYYVLGTSLDYYSQTELQKMFPNATVESEIHIMAFENPKEVLRHLQLTGVNAIEHQTWTKKDLTSFENGYSNICCRRATLTYNPIYLRLCKTTTK